MAGTRNHRGAAGHEAKAGWTRSQSTWEAAPGSEAFSCRKGRTEEVLGLEEGQLTFV